MVSLTAMGIRMLFNSYTIKKKKRPHVFLSLCITRVLCMCIAEFVSIAKLSTCICAANNISGLDISPGAAPRRGI